MKNVKESFINYYKELLGDEAEDFFEAFENPKFRRTVRVNTLKTSKDFLNKWLENCGYKVSDNPFSEDGIDIEGQGSPLSLKIPYISGFTYPQDSSSMFAVELLNPKPGEVVIDLTAAPGGKTSHIAQKMKNSGVLIANDMDTSRLRALHSNLERLGVWNTAVIRMMPHKIAEIYPETFDKVLLDPSCSGEGLLAKGKTSFWSPKSLKRYASDQFGMLKSAFKLLKPGGTLVYSTCTLNKYEDDGVVERLLEEFPEAELPESSHVSKFTPKQLKGFLGFRFWPQFTHTKGFFCIAIRKKITESCSSESVKKNIYYDKTKLKVLSKSELKRFKILSTILGHKVSFTEKDDYIFAVSKELSKFNLIKYASLSFPICKIYNSQIKPTHVGALLLGLNTSDSDKGILNISKVDVQKILDRQIIDAEANDGDYIIKFEKFPIGYGKVTNNKLEVSIPKQY